MMTGSFVMALVATLALILVTASVEATQDALAGKKSEYTQATPQVNECGNGKLPLNVGCQNTGSQIQGDENTISLAAEQRFPSGEVPIPPEDTATLIVKKVVECPSGFECPEPADFEMNTLIRGAIADPEFFLGSSIGTEISLVGFEEEGFAVYSVIELQPTSPPGLELDLIPGAGCNGVIFPDQTITCIMRNVYTETP
jgi:hypothetical protein